MIRAAALADVDAIARIINDGWRQTYRTLPPRFYDQAALARRRSMWQDLLTYPPAGAVARVAVLTEQVVGSAMAGPSRDPAPAGAWQLFSLYVAKPYQGMGVGSLLLDAVLGGQPAHLWVAQSNTRAIAFYAQHGLRLDGTRKVDADLDGLVELRLVRPAPPLSQP